MKRVYIDYEDHPDLGSRQRIYLADDGEKIPSEYLIGKRITGVYFQDDRIYLELDERAIRGQT